MSRVGTKPIPLPDKVALKLDGNHLTVEGPKGHLVFSLPEGVSLEQSSGHVTVTRGGDHRRLRALHGTARSLISNMIDGVSKGYVRDLEIQGVGFRAAVSNVCDIDVENGGFRALVKGENFAFSLDGTAPQIDNNPKKIKMPAGLKVSLGKNNKMVVVGIEKKAVEGFVSTLAGHGVGLASSDKGVQLDLSLGRSHLLLHPIPEGIKVTVTDNTKIRVEGIDKQAVGQFAADVRGYYPPEPYKGKGVRYAGEHVRRKEGKTVGK